MDIKTAKAASTAQLSQGKTEETGPDEKGFSQHSVHSTSTATAWGICCPSPAGMGNAGACVDIEARMLVDSANTPLGHAAASRQRLRLRASTEKDRRSGLSDAKDMLTSAALTGKCRGRMRGDISH